MTGGRPLRFLAITLGGWATIRVVLLLPQAGPIPALIDSVMPPAAAAILGTRPPGARIAQAVPAKPVPDRASHPGPMPTSIGTVVAVMASIASVRETPSQAVPVSVMIPPPLPPTPVRSVRSRWSGSGWGLVRGGAGGTVSGGQLGASQAGVRLLYALGDSRRLAIAARVAAPLRGRGREAALGLEWRPIDLPIRLITEQRFVLDGGRGGPTVGIIGGYGPATVAPGLLFESYGQAGVIRRDGMEAFVDASARLSHPVATIGKARFDVGFGAWGSAQRGAERLDVGPSIGIAVPVADRALRLNLDWRHRVAGHARPGSGPALSVGTDF